MKIWLASAFAALTVVSGCETLTESYSVERSDVINDGGVHVYSDLMENAWDGARYWQFRAGNYSDYPFCVQAGLNNVRFSNGHSMGYNHYVAPGETKDIGYVNAPADFEVDARTWDPGPDGRC